MWPPIVSAAAYPPPVPRPVGRFGGYVGAVAAPSSPRRRPLLGSPVALAAVSSPSPPRHGWHG
eukprot:6863701-Pyramimonas_sp.AAC.1